MASWIAAEGSISNIEDLIKQAKEKCLKHQSPLVELFEARKRLNDFLSYYEKETK